MVLFPQKSNEYIKRIHEALTKMNNENFTNFLSVEGCISLIFQEVIELSYLLKYLIVAKKINISKNSFGIVNQKPLRIEKVS